MHRNLSKSALITVVCVLACGGAEQQHKAIGDKKNVHAPPVAAYKPWFFLSPYASTLFHKLPATHQQTQDKPKKGQTPIGVGALGAAHFARISLAQFGESAPHPVQMQGIGGAPSQPPPLDLLMRFGKRRAAELFLRPGNGVRALPIIRFGKLRAERSGNNLDELQ